jgi:Lon protease-like protein
VTEVGLFPLDVVLLPGERIPLHIFEERYQELIGECLAAESPFGLILGERGGMRGIGTLATVTDVVERFDDGRLNVLVRGGQRFTVEAITEGRSFLTAVIAPFDDGADAEPPTPEETAACLRAYGELVREVEADAEEPDLTADSLAFELAGRIAFEAGAKQELLELRSERARVALLIGMLDRAVEQVRRRRRIRTRAAGNGHVEP